MSGFSKLFGSMWQGSLYGKFEASAVFMVLLSLCDSDGVVDMTPEAIAGTTGWPLPFIQAGIVELVQPDSRSRTPNEEGRRIIALDDHRDWGWSITNYSFYRQQMRSLERREYLREAKRKERTKSTVVNMSTAVNPVQPIAEAECRGRVQRAEALGVGEQKRAARSTAAHLPVDFTLTEVRRDYGNSENIDPEREFAKFCDYWRAASGAAARKRDWDAAWRGWCRKAADFRPMNATRILPSAEMGKRIGQSEAEAKAQGIDIWALT